ncbi:hemoglobinase-like [Adelges cooleyi]|uniref:hemoglobinase-like n=1 Tax=Adelges cooleyi TaxID=133065 RepID=UPI0021804FAA|nr:hemoglobinase-like [Adelges cooleyi]
MLMNIWIIFALYGGAVVSSDHQESNEEDNRQSYNPEYHTWAVLVAGSKGWIRYRHQSNVGHAYKLLTSNGIPRHRIITFMYDDIAYNPENPDPGVIKNEPNGTNVYEDVPIDYSGENVSKDVFLDVLLARRANVKSIGSGRVLGSDKSSNVLLFFTGLGTHDRSVVFPNDDELFSQEIIKNFKTLYDLNRYKNLLVFWESSHSGTLFEDILPHNIRALVATAGGPDEDTWGEFCDIDIKPCLAGLFSYHWMSLYEQMETKQQKSISIFDHFDSLRNTVSHTKKEHPQLYGHWKVGNLPISYFLGSRKPNVTSRAEKKRLNMKFGHQSNDIDSVVHRPLDQLTETLDVQSALTRIVDLVIGGDSSIKKYIKKDSTTDAFNSKCFKDLISSFNDKCIGKNKDIMLHKEGKNILANLCDTSILLIKRMEPTQAVEIIC